MIVSEHPPYKLRNWVSETVWVKEAEILISRRKKEEGRRKKEEKFSYLGEKEECLYSQLFSHPYLMFN
ncbi:hypothetical protein [Phormidium nigroviride]